MESRKVKTTFYCQKCGREAQHWIGKCPACNSWNTYAEVPKLAGSERPQGILPAQRTRPVCIEDVHEEQKERIKSGVEGIDELLGGGIVAGSLVLIGGEPGIGKSTLLMQIALKIKDRIVLYVSGEESPQQVKMRAKRVSTLSATCYIVGERCLEHVVAHAKETKAAILVIDSIQTLYSAHVESSAGSMLQVRACTSLLMEYSKESGVATFIVGHINKEGALAGPKVLEHIVDTVLQFEGDRHHMYRILRVIKNRFGAAGELGVYELDEHGLKKVQNPSQFFLQDRSGTQSGIAIASTMEGNHPFLIEVQSLVSKATYAGVQRICTGFDNKRLNVLLAMLERKKGFVLSSKDVFLNMTGGIRIEDPAADLAVCICVISSLYDKSIPHDTIFSAEVGLGGELRPIKNLKKRIAEAEKLGFKRIYVPKANTKEEISNKKIDIFPAVSLSTVIKDVFTTTKSLV